MKSNKDEPRILVGREDPRFSAGDMILMYKLGYRMVEGLSVPPEEWASDKGLEEVALLSVESLLGCKADSLKECRKTILTTLIEKQGILLKMPQAQNIAARIPKPAKETEQ